ncbi:spore germination protein [Paenibacillus antibioticophila]|uniref:Spore germination protein n=1 Tax=Paenibacillus antibioticophila TaxID=1274374 RepID=A0A919XSF6_9BACL|nr:spore germination protein [Paenibacillus antibioticophila]GIO36713.1 spore germination protein [Paenibacillus antibioticophila]
MPFRRKTPLPKQSKAANSSSSPQSQDYGTDLESRLHWLENEFENCADIIIRRFTISTGNDCAIIYIRNMINQLTVQNSIIRSLQREAAELKEYSIYEFLFDARGLTASQNDVISDLKLGMDAVLQSGVLLLIDGDERMLTFNISDYPTRSIEEAPNESVIRGPRESFIEDLEKNLTFLRRRIKSNQLKIEFKTLGRLTNTSIAIVYVEGICKPELVKEIKRRMAHIDTASIEGATSIEEIIEDNPYSPFPQLQYTERPDVVSGSLLEGRIAILVDGTPMALLAPVTLPMLLQSSEDYYQRYVAANWIRWIRFFFVVVSLLLPSLYIAVTTFHPEMIPSKLLITIAAARENVPFPALMEAFMMEIAFEALREASVRIPKSIGQAVSIIGALIIGTAAVEAGIVSAAMVIIVSLTGIASFIIPHFDLGLSFRLLRFPIMLLASLLGMYGIACGLILVFVHLVNLKSFGVPYLSPVTPLVTKDLNDTLVRAPWWKMDKRPLQLTRNVTRQGNHARAWTKQKGELE